MGKVSKGKQTKAFLKRGLLDGQIKKRHEARAFKQKVKGRQVQRNKGHGPKKLQQDGDESDGADSLDEKPTKKRKQGEDDDDDDDEDDEEMDVDDVLGANGLDDEDDEEDDDDAELEDDDLSGLESDEERGSKSHVADLKALAEKDPEFFKYLQENDAELLQFDENDANGDDSEQDDDEDDDLDDDDDDEDEDDDEPKSKKGKAVAKTRQTPVLTQEMLRKWQKAILQTRSIRSLKKLLLAFRSAATSGAEADAESGARWDIQSPKVFNDLIVTALKFTPVVLARSVPYKEKDGKFKLSTNTKQFATAQRLIKSYFVSLQAMLNTVSSSSGIHALAVSESAKLVPWIVGNRKVARSWVKMLLGLYESASDEVRVAAFLALRKLAIASDHSLRESVLKGVYATFLASARATSVYTLPSLTLMKNAASEMFLLPGKQEQELIYQLTFGYIRMLAILLRKGVKEGSKDAFKSVYNWQFVHAIDFWSIVLSSACEKERIAMQGENPLQQLLYPLIQVALGAIRLVPTSRYFPLRFHLIRSLLRIVQRTGTYIPLSSALFEVLDSPDLSSKRHLKPSTLKPLDWEYYLKCPTAYQRTRVYADGLAEELVVLLTEYYGALSTSIAFPELVLPAIVALKRHSKKTGQAKLGSSIKVLVEKLEANAKWIEERRDKIDFAPSKRDKVDRFLMGEEKDKTPLGAYARLQRKVRDAKRSTLEKAAQGDAEDL